MGIIDFDIRSRTTVYYMAIFFITFSHGIAFTRHTSIVTALQITFILGYTLLTINDIFIRKNIHVSTLTYRIVIIIFIIYGITISMN